VNLLIRITEWDIGNIDRRGAGDTVFRRSFASRLPLALTAGLRLLRNTTIRLLFLDAPAARFNRGFRRSFGRSISKRFLLLAGCFTSPMRNCSLQQSAGVPYSSRKGSHVPQQHEQEYTLARTFVPDLFPSPLAAST
jgi:hypothetical protein